ncbi:MAG: SCO family protein [Xanthomonadales bacterium]|nr:SCO family protein [Xanthomonadales bacterium]
MYNAPVVVNQEPQVRPEAVLRSVIALLMLLAVSACWQQPAWNGLDVSGLFPDLEFTLVGESGETVTGQDFRGKTTLLFFGFTHCPGTCPATLGQLSVALDALGEQRSEVQVLLVSVDPARDTPEAMAQYTRRFGPWLHGITGDEASLRALNQAYKVDFKALPADEAGEYDVVHSARVFAFDATGRCRLLLPDASETDAVVSDLHRLLAENPGN